VTSVVIQLLVPLVLVGRVAHRAWAERTRGWVLLDAAITGLLLVVLARAALWLVLPWYLPWLLGALLGLALLAGLARDRRPGRTGERPATRSDAGRGRRRRPSKLGVAGRGVTGALLAVLALWAWAGSRAPEGPSVDLAFPLVGGSFLVANGGSTTLVNAHLHTLDAPEMAAFRGQSHAVDLVRVGAMGSRTRTPVPDRLDGWAIWEAALVAPCDGVVVRAVDDRPDAMPPTSDRDHPEGNHLILDCDGRWVVMAHLRQNSVAVEDGDRVASGTFVARVGNNGNSDEPHLHIHAQTPGSLEEPLGGTPLPITFGGRYLVRNDRIRSDADSTRH